MGHARRVLVNVMKAGLEMIALLKNVQTTVMKMDYATQPIMNVSVILDGLEKTVLYSNALMIVSNMVFVKKDNVIVIMGIKE